MIPDKCTNCGSEDLDSPSPVAVANNSVGHNQLGLNDVSIRFFIGCNSCSETVAVLTEDQVDIYPKDKLRQPKPSPNVG